MHKKTTRELAPRAASPRPSPSARVAHVVRTFGVLSETFVPDSIAALDAVGWQAWVVASSATNRESFPFPPDDRLLTGSRPPLTGRLAKRAFLQPPSARRAAWLRPALERIDPAVVHAQFGWAAVDVMAATRALNLPLIATFHMPDPLVPRSRRWRREYQRLYAELAVAVAVSDFVADVLRSEGYAGRLEVIPAGIPLERLPFRGPRPDSNDDRLLFIGRLVHYKGLDVLLRALPRVQAAHPRVRLEIIGAGPEGPAMQRLAAEVGVSGAVCFRGALPHDAVIAALERSDVLVIPSRQDAPHQLGEGSPVAPKEAMAVGLPVVGTRNGGIPSTIPPAFRQELVSEGSSSELAERLIETLSGRSGWLERSQAGRDWVASQFDWSVLAERIADLYAAST